MGVTVPELGLGGHDDILKPSLLDRGPGLGCFVLFLVLTGARPQTPGLLVPLHWLCRPSQAPAAGICHHWLEACSSSAGPGPLGPCKKKKKKQTELLSPAE